MTKTKIKFDNFSKAIKRLGDANTHYKSVNDEFSRDALIQRFEFTYELAWKSLYEVLCDQGMEDVMKTPKMIFQAAFEAGLIKNEDVWFQIMLARNKTSHQYDETESVEIAENISNLYLNEFRRLHKTLTGLYAQ